MIEYIKNGKDIMAIIIRSNYSEEGINFFTPDEFSQQIAYMKHPENKIILPHVHNPVKREVHFTKEVLFIKKGELRVDFYSNNQQYLFSKNLLAGDFILLSEGGHGFKVIKDLEMVEIKQGPYAGEKDKTRFDAIDESKIIIQ
jgi:mannose-6-phosphate isomerase-like protein (cupin superfamily)